jgi:DNA-3-methyladenine glycosylase II
MIEKTNYQKASEQLIASDARFAVLITEMGYPNFEPNTDYFNSLVSIIIGQQLSGAAAKTIQGRFYNLFDHGKPSPNLLRDMSYETMRSAGLSRAKAHSILELAARFANGAIPADLHTLTNSEIQRLLTTTKGVGAWTVDMFLMFNLCRPDVLPLGDLGVRKGMQRFFKLAELPNPRQMQVLAEPWQPFRSMGSWYMWRVLESNSPV